MEPEGARVVNCSLFNVSNVYVRQSRESDGQDKRMDGVRETQLEESVDLGSIRNIMTQTSLLKQKQNRVLPCMGACMSSRSIQKQPQKILQFYRPKNNQNTEKKEPVFRKKMSISRLTSKTQQQEAIVNGLGQQTPKYPNFKKQKSHIPPLLPNRLSHRRTDKIKNKTLQQNIYCTPTQQQLSSFKKYYYDHLTTQMKSSHQSIPKETQSTLMKPYRFSADYRVDQERLSKNYLEFGNYRDHINPNEMMKGLSSYFSQENQLEEKQERNIREDLEDREIIQKRENVENRESVENTENQCQKIPQNRFIDHAKFVVSKCYDKEIYRTSGFVDSPIILPNNHSNTSLKKMPQLNTYPNSQPKITTNKQFRTSQKQQPFSHKSSIPESQPYSPVVIQAARTLNDLNSHYQKSLTDGSSQHISIINNDFDPYNTFQGSNNHYMTTSSLYKPTSQHNQLNSMLFQFQRFRKLGPKRLYSLVSETRRNL